MGYHVQIIRKSGGVVRAIQKSEIEKLVGLISGARIAPPSLKSATLDLIVMHEGKDACWLTLQNGVLWSKDPEPNELKIMISLAQKLDARVRGDNFESYRSPDDTYIDAEDLEEKRNSNIEGQRILKASKSADLKIKIVIISIFALLGAVAYFVGTIFEK